MSIGLFILRVVVGGLFVGHGTQKLYGWFGGGGPEGTGKFFSQIGYSPGKQMAYLAGATEAGSGALMMLGLLTPLAAAGIIGVMVGTLPVHAPKGLWNTNGGFELPLAFAASAAALAYAGAGNYSIDHAIGWLASGGAIGTAAVAFGALTGAVMIAVRAGHVQAEEQQRSPRKAA